MLVLNPSLHFRRSSYLPSYAKPRLKLQLPLQARLPRISATTNEDDSLTTDFKNLLEYCEGHGCVRLGGTSNQNGLLTLSNATTNQVLLRVPKAMAIVVDYQTGLSIPEGSWPRLHKGLSMADPLPWDLLAALALMDALAGEGHAFWQAYTQALLPSPDALTLPMCWSHAQLTQLQHGAIEAGAREQQERLLETFGTDMMEPVGEDMPSWLQWAFACVRSRAFKVGSDAFAMVPFLDQANHSANPNADFRVASDGAFELVALRDIACDEEVTLSYTGAEGFTNQRLMAQYGFVLPGGNPADRLVFELPAGFRPEVDGLSLEHMQQALGDALFIEAVTARHPYLHASLKSLPFAPEQAASLGDAGPQSTAAQTASCNSRGKERIPGLGLAQTLRAQCSEMLQGCETTQEEDEALINGWTASQGAPSAGVGVPASAATPDARLLAAMHYRLERKRLINACQMVLDAYGRTG